MIIIVELLEIYENQSTTWDCGFSFLLILCLLTSSRFVRFNVSRTGALGGIWGEGVSCFLFEFEIFGFFLIDAIDENEEFVDEDRFPLSMTSVVFTPFLCDLSELFVF